MKFVNTGTVYYNMGEYSMITKDIQTKSTLLTIYFYQEEAERLVEILNKAHRRYKFEIKVNSEGTYEVYAKHRIESSSMVKNEILWFLLDRIAYDLAK